jgi:hypothetical protein
MTCRAWKVSSPHQAAFHLVAQCIFVIQLRPSFNSARNMHSCTSAPHATHCFFVPPLFAGGSIVERSCRMAPILVPLFLLLVAILPSIASRHLRAGETVSWMRSICGVMDHASQGPQFQPFS